MTILVERDPTTTVRCLWQHAGVLYAGIAGPVHPRGSADAHGLLRIDLATGRELGFHPTRLLVSDVAVVGGRVFASLSIGELLEWLDLECSKPPFTTEVDINSLRFAVHRGELWFGTYGGEIISWSAGVVAAVMKRLSTIAIGDGFVAGSYEDGKVRVWRLVDGVAEKKARVIAIGKPARCTFFDGALWTTGARGELTRWNVATLQEELRITVPVGKYGAWLRTSEDRLVAIGGGELRVISGSGEIVGEARVDGVVNALCVARDRLYVGVGPTIHAIEV